MRNISSIKIRDRKEVIDSMNPIAIYIDNICVWDDEVNTLGEYQAVLRSEEIFLSLRFKIVSYHHSIVYIETF